MNYSDHSLETLVEEPCQVDEGVDWRSRIVNHLQISNILRLAGGGFTIAAIIIFLFQRWENASDLYRYGMIFGETLILAGLGFATSHWLKDQRSARVFLGLSLVSTSAVFTILAAMIHSQVQWMPVATNLPDFAVWAIDSMDSVLPLLAASFIVLGAQSLFTLTVLARPAARGLSLLLMLNISLLLLPIRDMGITTLIVLPALLFGFRTITRLRKSTPAMRTAEGAMAGLLVLLPLVIMIGRGASLYAHGPVAIGSLALLTYLVLRQIAQSITQAPRFRTVLEVVSLLPAAVASLQLVTLIDYNIPLLSPWLIVIFGVTLSVFLMDLALHAASGRERYLRAALYTVLLVSVIHEASYPTVASALFGLVVSALVLFFSIAVREQSVLKLSILPLLGSLILLVSKIVFTLNAGTWISMTILGMATIVLAAAVDRYGKQLMEAVQKLK
ncbi:MAG: hypothetical protein P8103_05440 [Candidatus Thiodiazotropha sp.]